MPLDNDTTAAAHEAQIAALRRLGPAGRMQLAAEMSEDARRIAIEGELRRHPELSEAQARRVVFERIWGPELTARIRAHEARRAVGEPAVAGPPAPLHDER